MIDTASRLVLAIGMVLMLGACEPQDRRPGLWLRGELQPYPEDWGFANRHLEIAIQVAAPYFLPHSVTIGCAELQGDLFVLAFRPETKNWPAWVTDDPDVVLKVGEDLFEARLTRIEDPLVIANALRAFAAKYRQAGSVSSGVWFWRVGPRV